MRSAAVLLLAFLVAGCSQSGAPAPTRTGEPTVTTTWSPTESSTTSTWHGCPPECFQGHLLHLGVHVGDGGPHEVGVPFPHGAWCLQPGDWSQERADNATAQVRAVDRGTVLWVATTGKGTVSWVVDVADRPACQTFRYDPWSVEPDPADGTVDVQADGAALVQVFVTDQDGACSTDTDYAGTTSSGWSTLKESWNGTVCA